MATRIDDALVQRLISARMQSAITTATVYFIGQEIPEIANVLTVLLRLELRPMPRANVSDADHANLAIVAQVEVPPDEHASSYAIGQLVAEVAHALDEWTGVDAGSTHEIHLGRATREIRGQETDLGSLSIATVSVAGRVTRQSGETRESGYIA